MEEVLGRFGPNPVEAREGYQNFVLAGWNQGRRNELIGGGLIRSAGGVDEVLRRRPEEREAADERLLGSGQFVEAVWRAVEPKKAVTPKREWQAISKEVSERFEIDEKHIFDGSRRRTISSARAEFFARCREEAGLSVAQLARLSGLHPASVSKAIDRGRREGKAGQKRK